MDEQTFNEGIILAADITSIGIIIVEKKPIVLTLAETLAPFSYKTRKKFQELKERFERDLDNNGIKRERYEITMRPKSPGSTFFHALINDFLLEDMVDLYGIRFLTEKLEDTYRISNVLIKKYGLADCLSHEWPNKQRPGFIDWIKAPRSNGFRSLEYFIQIGEGYPINIQGRTYEIERENEKGLAAHRFYKKRQLTKFQSECLEDEEFRVSKLRHSKKLVDSFLESYYNN
ncbi:hypothetical protein J4216_00335 [Candidatus Woesearchaeota archaeon]|nr:hypothetical protein [Candidatus Woesearchaeota archaeon]